MKVAKWGNSLAVRLPAALVEKLNLKDGDEIELTVKADRELEVSQDETRQQILEEIRKLRKPLPEGYKFNREELYDRGDREQGALGKPGAAAD